MARNQRNCSEGLVRCPQTQSSTQCVAFYWDVGVTDGQGHFNLAMGQIGSEGTMDRAGGKR